MHGGLAIITALGLALAVAGSEGSWATGAAAAGSGESAAGLDANVGLRVSVAPLLAVSLERSCPPPGILACRPAIRITARLRGEPSRGLRRSFRALLRAGLCASGYRRLAVEPSSSGEFAGRVISQEEILARWQLDRGVLELATGGLELRDGGLNASLMRSPPADDGGEEPPAVRIEANPGTLAGLVGTASPCCRD